MAVLTAPLPQRSPQGFHVFRELPEGDGGFLRAGLHLAVGRLGGVFPPGVIHDLVHGGEFLHLFGFDKEFFGVHKFSLLFETYLSYDLRLTTYDFFFIGFRAREANRQIIPATPNTTASRKPLS